MIEVFKTVHDFYHLEAAVMLNFNTLILVQLEEISTNYRNLHVIET